MPQLELRGPPGVEPHPTRPTLVAIHGMEETEEVWRDLRAGIDADVITPRYRWSGEDGYAWALDAADQASALAYDLRARNLPANHVLVAHSYGAILTLSMVARGLHTSASAMILVCPFAMPRTRELDWETIQHFTAALDTLLTESIRLRFSSRATDEIVGAAVSILRDKIGPLGCMEFIRNYALTATLPLERLTIPCCVITGAQDRICRPADNQELIARLPRSRPATIPRAGHFPMIDQPDAFIAEVRRFLDTTFVGSSATTIERHAR